MRFELAERLEEERNEKNLRKPRNLHEENRSGFAYSSAPGNDKLVTDSLSNRLKEALANKLFGSANMMLRASETPKGKVDYNETDSLTG